MLSRAFLEAEDNDEYENESDADAEPMQQDNLHRRDIEVSLHGTIPPAQPWEWAHARLTPAHAAIATHALDVTCRMRQQQGGVWQRPNGQPSMRNHRSEPWRILTVMAMTVYQR